MTNSCVWAPQMDHCSRGHLSSCTWMARLGLKVAHFLIDQLPENSEITQKQSYYIETSVNLLSSSQQVYSLPSSDILHLVVKTFEQLRWLHFLMNTWINPFPALMCTKIDAFASSHVSGDNFDPIIYLLCWSSNAPVSMSLSWCKDCYLWSQSLVLIYISCGKYFQL